MSEEFLALSTRNIAAGLRLNWGANWDEKTRADVIAHLMKVATALDLLRTEEIPANVSAGE